MERSPAATPQRVAHNVAALPPNIAPSVIPLPSVRAGLAFCGEADPPLEDTRSVDHLSPGTNGLVIRSGEVVVALVPRRPETLGRGVELQLVVPHHLASLARLDRQF
jgi:hypothetical protein